VERRPVVATTLSSDERAEALARLDEIERLTLGIRDDFAEFAKSYRAFLEKRAEELDDEAAAAFEERMRVLSDDDLVFVLLGLLGRPEWDETLPLLGATSHATASMTRFAFCELAERWLPAGLLEEATRRIYDERPTLEVLPGGLEDAR
jgi:hypothetical protein